MIRHLIAILLITTAVVVGIVDTTVVLARDVNLGNGDKAPQVVPTRRDGTAIDNKADASLDLVDRSGTTSATAGTFTNIGSPNSARQYLRVTNRAASGTLYVWDKTSGTPNVNNTIPLSPGQSFIWDIKVPKGQIQVGGSSASMGYESAEG